MDAKTNNNNKISSKLLADIIKDGRFAIPDGLVAPAHGGVILGPVGNAPLRPRDMMTTAGIGLVRHGERIRAVRRAR